MIILAKCFKLDLTTYPRQVEAGATPPRGRKYGFSMGVYGSKLFAIGGAPCTPTEYSGIDMLDLDNEAAGWQETNATLPKAAHEYEGIKKRR